MSDQVEAPWLPGKLRVEDQCVETDSLRTYWLKTGIVISDWKTERHYIDARDVSPASFPHHPAHFLDDRFPRLRGLLEATPVFALGGEVRPFKDALKNARRYTVGFVRTADDYLTVEAEGPSFSRKLGAPFLDIERALGIEYGTYSSREYLIDRILHHFTDGRLTRQSLDLAEMWLALAGGVWSTGRRRRPEAPNVQPGPSLFFFADEAERMAYLRVLEDGLEEAFTRAKPHEAMHNDILTALREAEQSNAARVELPGLGVVQRKTIAAEKLKGKRKRARSGDIGGVYLDYDGKSSITLPPVRSWHVSRAVPNYVPAAIKTWEAGAAERIRRYDEQAWAKAEAQRKLAMRKFFLILVALVIVVGAPCIHVLRKRVGGEPCQTGADCRSGYCREIEPGRGVCLIRCNARTTCSKGRSCEYDPALQHFFCEPPK